MENFLQSQIDLVLAVQALGGLRAVMQAFTFLGSEEFFLLLLPLVYLCIDASFGARLAILLLLGDSLNGLLKLAFHLPRPYWADPRVQALAQETSYGLPSGHAQNATGVWFLAAAQIKKPWAWIAAGVLVLGISLSRIYLGVHYPVDVVGGWILGGLTLGIYLWAEPKARAWLSGLSLWGQVGAAFGAALGIVALGLLVRASISGAPDPSTWASFAAESRSLNGLAADAGALFGGGTGLAMANRWARFDAGGPLWKRAARFAIALVGVGVLYFGLRLVFPREPEAAGLFFRFVRYGIATWWAIFLAPFILIRLKLASPQISE